MYKNRLKKIIDLSFESLYEKINGGLIVVQNEASLQLHLSSIMKTIGELFIYKKNELFLIELEKTVELKNGIFEKSQSSKARIDILISIENILGVKHSSCAIELKYFKKSNNREPNNRYDVFKDIKNLEMYGEYSDFGILLVATNHEHYISKENYSQDTSDFDFRNDSEYIGGTKLEYRTNKPYGKPITLSNSYHFKWKKAISGISFMLLDVDSSNITN